MKKTPTLVALSVLTTLTILSWVAFELYRAFSLEPPQEVREELLAPINPSLDRGLLDELQRRRGISESELLEDVVEALTEDPAVAESTEEADLEPEEDDVII